MKRFVLALALLPVVAAAQRWPAPILEPTTYVSPSGNYQLWVNPSDPFGKGKGFCRLSRDGKVVWSKDLPFTFYEAKVAVDMNGKALWIYRPKGWTENWLVFPSLGGIALYDGTRTVTWVRP